MKIPYNIGFIGGGNMARAIVNGIINARLCRPVDLAVSDVNTDLHNVYRKIDIFFSTDNLETIKKSDIVFLAIKPQQATEVLETIRDSSISLENKCFVTIMAGISTDFIQEKLGCPVQIIRVMPNTALMIRQGACAISCDKCQNDRYISTVKTIFEAMGSVEIIPENKMNEVISVNGSSPAYFYFFADAMIRCAVQQGIDTDIAKRLIAQTMIGCGNMLEMQAQSPKELLDMVCSKGGTTIEAIDVLKTSLVDEAIVKAMNACTKRAKELSL